MPLGVQSLNRTHWRLITSQYCSPGVGMQWRARPTLLAIAYLVYPLDLPVYGQVIQGRAGGTLMSWHVHADQMQVLWKELRTHRPRKSVCGMQTMSAHFSEKAAPTYQVT